jgi:hypothetical protein
MRQGQVCWILPMEWTCWCVFICPFTSTAKTASFYWMTNQQEIKDTPVHDQKVGVWCGISRNRISGRIIFDGTISWESYCEVTLYPFVGRLNEDEIARHRFQQDGATAHTARVSMTLLRHTFGGRIVAKDIRPPRSPSLTPLCVVCGEQWKGQIIKTVLTLSMNWRKPSEISSRTSLWLNCRVSLQTK